MRISLRTLPVSLKSGLDNVKSFFRIYELCAVLVLFLGISVVGFLYNSLLVRKTALLDKLQDESTSLRKQIDKLKASQNARLVAIRNTEAAVLQLNEFENRFLRDITSGRLALIDEIHRLTAKNNLEIDSDISFEREKDSPGKLKLRSGKEDLSKEYPSIKASFAVIGRYSDIRSFISELESSELFLIVEGIRLNSEKEALLSVELSIRCYFRQQ